MLASKVSSSSSNVSCPSSTNTSASAAAAAATAEPSATPVSPARNALGMALASPLASKAKSFGSFVERSSGCCSESSSRDGEPDGDKVTKSSSLMAFVSLPLDEGDDDEKTSIEFFARSGLGFGLHTCTFCANIERR